MRRAGLALLLLALTAPLLPGCGGDDEAPLSPGLTDAQQLTLERAWEQRMTTLAAGIDTVDDQARALYTVCAQLDQSSAFLQVVRRTCQPTAVVAKLRARLDDRCDVPSAQCVRALDRLAAANTTLAGTLQELGDAVKSATQDPECRAQFTPSDATLEAFSELTSAYQAWVLGIQRQDRDFRDLGRRRAEEARERIYGGAAPSQRVTQLREACELPDAA